jgi:hypothetical protein
MTRRRALHVAAFTAIASASGFLAAGAALYVFMLHAARQAEERYGDLLAELDARFTAEDEAAA